MPGPVREDRRARRTLPFECRGHFAIQLCTRDGTDARVKPLPHQSVPERMSQIRCSAGVVGCYAQPQMPAGERLYLATVYKNMAALDGLNERSDAITGADRG